MQMGHLTAVDVDRDGTADYYIYEPPTGVALDRTAVARAARHAKACGIAPGAFARFVQGMLYERLLRQAPSDLRSDGAGSGRARADALRAIAAIRADAAHAYHDGARPGHAQAVRDMEALYRTAYPG